MDKSAIQRWVRQYFQEFNENPGNVGKHYDEHAILSRDDNKVSRKNRILAVYTGRGYNSPKVDEQTIKFDYVLADPQKYDEGGMIVNVWGSIMFLGQQGKKKFNQSFVLMTDDHGHLKITRTILSVHD